MRLLLPLLVVAACDDPNPRLVFERQAATVAAATDVGWSNGGAIIVGDPSSFTFPQPLAVRFKIIDDETNPDMPAELAISAATMTPYGTGPFEIAIAPACSGTSCTAQLSITGQGPSMVKVTADGPEGTETDCFYYALVDATVDATMLHDELETQQRDCRFGN